MHTDACFEDRIICGMEDVPGHVHTTECVQRVQVCTLEENHVHTEKCFGKVLTCGFAEELGHVHTAGCFDDEGHAVCGKTQYLRHEHNENCFTNTLSGHVHSDACYSNVPQCGHVEHVHTDACYQVAPNGENTGMVSNKIESDGIMIEGVDGTELPENAAAVLNQVTDLQEKEAVWTELQSILNPPAQNPVLKKSNLISRSAVEETLQNPASDFAVFDIALENVEELNGKVRVTVDGLSIDLNALVPENAKVTGVQYTLYHIHDGSVSNPEVSVVENDHVIQGFTFETDNFSNFVLQYTVDFEYTDPESGEIITWSWGGEGSYKIQDILAQFGVEDEIINLSLVRTIDAGSPENVLYLEEKEDGWYLTSDAAFKDTFELTVDAGGKVYTIIVRDEVL